MAYLITYDLAKPGRNYQPLYEAIKRLGSWCHALESVWLIETSRTAAQILDALLPLIDHNDSLFITGLSGEYSGWLGQNARQWLGSHRLAA